jgi:hypothetical protein
VRSACDSERPTTVTHGKSWSLGGCGQESTGSALTLIRALATSPKLVVRDRINHGRQWQAVALFGKRDVLTADTADGLLYKIRKHYPGSTCTA